MINFGIETEQGLLLVTKRNFKVGEIGDGSLYE